MDNKELLETLNRYEAQIAELQRAVGYYSKLSDEVASYNVQVDSEVILLKRNLEEKRLGYKILLALHEIIGSSINIENFFSSTLELILTTLNMDRVVVFWKEESQKSVLKPTWFLGYAQDEVNAAFSRPLEKAVFENAGEQGILVNKSTRRNEWQDKLSAYIKLPFFLGTRIVDQGQTVGWLIAGREKEALPFYPPLMPENVETFEVMAGFIKATYFNFRLYNRLEQANARLENYNQELEKKVEERTRDIEQSRQELAREKDKSDELLLNILPYDVAEELKNKGYYSAKRLEEETILFTDFVNFTNYSEMMAPEDLVADLDQCFRVFDGIITKHGLEKIKTIGDSYMAAAAVDQGTEESAALSAILAGIEMQEYVQNDFKSHSAQLKVPFRMRLGINTGPVVAGIVGVKKFQYDIWGDTVNTASRMESYGAIGKVNISAATYEYVKNVPYLKFEARGKIEVKGKGEIEMYFVSVDESLKPG
ncbi:MAG: hypothetical protein H6606_03365 [Flavobacteriales bacterium]|nr:hypothetical protein [Flavobacteriales bacterium]